MVVSLPPTIFPSPAKQVRTLIPQYQVILHNPRALQESCERTFQLSLHAIIIQPHSERPSQSTIPMDIDPARRNKKPRLLLETEREKLDEFVDSIHYSARYNDDKFEYRHVQLPKNMLKKIPTDYFDSSKGTLKLLWEEEWRALGITQSLGWEHYEVHEPEPHILLFKRPLNYQPPLQQ
ncbi:hypothetical protein ACN42_g9719 [Penicillium freii]|uniref:Cyclin-dependent kinases regulatory subunit n=14 Tax=Penicillium TaxID=5073 RepID=A0A117NLC4_PENFR|nr:hypothetical protein ACN42_g9719 [Penicillium freii]